MTKEERKLANDLAGFSTVELHKHTSLNGKNYWKVKHDGRALMCITYTLCTRMGQRGYIGGDNSLRTLNVLALRAALLDWQAKKDKRATRKPRKVKVNPENIF